MRGVPYKATIFKVSRLQDGHRFKEDSRDRMAYECRFLMISGPASAMLKKIEGP